MTKEKDMLYEKVVDFVKEKFAGKKDKSGKDYFTAHLLTVSKIAKSLGGSEAEILGLLHDAFEDTDTTEEDLINLGVSDEIITALKLLTHKKPMSYSDYVKNIAESGNKLAMLVKLSDLSNNMDITRIKEPKQEDYDRITVKYIPAMVTITKALGELN